MVPSRLNDRWCVIRRGDARRSARDSLTTLGGLGTLGRLSALSESAGAGGQQSSDRNYRENQKTHGILRTAADTATIHFSIELTALLVPQLALEINVTRTRPDRFQGNWW